MHGLLENPYHDNTKSRITNENNQAEIHGTKASEMIFGNVGNDVIISGGGKSDTLVGGAGADTYVFSTVFSPNGKEVESAKIIDGVSGCSGTVKGESSHWPRRRNLMSVV